MRIGLNPEKVDPNEEVKVIPIEDGKVLRLLKLFKQNINNGTVRYSGKEIFLSNYESNLLEKIIAEKIELAKSGNSTSEDIILDNKFSIYKERSVDDLNKNRTYLLERIAELVRDGEIIYKDGTIMPNKELENMIKEVNFPNESNYETLTIKGKTAVTKAETKKEKIEKEKANEYSIIYIKSKNSTRK